MKCVIMQLVLLLSFSVYGTDVTEPTHREECVQIIYLNGASSSGKSTLAQALQEALGPPFLHIGIDRVLAMMPAKLNDWSDTSTSKVASGFSWKKKKDETGHEFYDLQVGPFGKKITQTLKEIVLTLVKMGHFVIIDDVSMGKEDVDSWQQALEGYKVLWVGVKTPLSILEEREKARGDRLIGQARGHYLQVHKDVVYDIDYDPTKISLENIVQAIKDKACNRMEH